MKRTVPVSSLVEVPVSSLVEDFDLYPRHAVDDSHVADLARAYRADCVLPPIIINAIGSQIIDGFHRRRAWIRVYGDAGTITVDARQYDSVRAMITEAVSLNAAHGRRLDQQDRTRSILMLERAGVPLTHISVILHTTEARIEQLRVRIVSVDGEVMPSKPISYSRQNPLGDITQAQYDVMLSSSGHRTGQIVGQLIKELRIDLVDVKDERIVARLWDLHDTIEEVLPARD